MSDKKETANEKPQSQQPQSSAETSRPQSVYIKNSAEYPRGVHKKKE
jgi:hypothetical protein